MTAFVRPSPELIQKRRIARRGKDFDRFNSLHYFGKGGFYTLCRSEHIIAHGYASTGHLMHGYWNKTFWDGYNLRFK